MKKTTNAVWELQVCAYSPYRVAKCRTNLAIPANGSSSSHNRLLASWMPEISLKIAAKLVQYTADVVVVADAVMLAISCYARMSGTFELSYTRFELPIVYAISSIISISNWIALSLFICPTLSRSRPCVSLGYFHSCSLDVSKSFLFHAMHRAHDVLMTVE